MKYKIKIIYKYAIFIFYFSWSDGLHFDGCKNKMNEMKLTADLTSAHQIGWLEWRNNYRPLLNTFALCFLLLNDVLLDNGNYFRGGILF